MKKLIFSTILTLIMNSLFGQQVAEMKYSICKEPTIIKLEKDKKDGVLKILIGNTSFLLKDSVDDKKIKDQITDVLKKNLPISCQDLDLVEYQKAVDYFPDLAINKLHNKPGRLRLAKIDKNYEIWEMIDDKLLYSYALVNLQDKSSKTFLINKQNEYRFESSKIDSIFIKNTDSVLRFIKKNDKVQIPNIYLVQIDKKWYYILNIEISDNKIVKADTILIDKDLLNKLKGEKLKITYNSIEVYDLKTEKSNDDEVKVKLNSLQAKRISFVLGVGGVYGMANLYQMPVVNPTNGNVQIETAQRGKSNLSVGIVYTPYLYNFFDAEHPEGKIVSAGMSYALFINPITFTKATDMQGYFNSVDFGAGIGYKFVGGVMLLGTLEFFSVNQPRAWFVSDYSNGTNKYVLPNNTGTTDIQKSFDPEDNNIFKKKFITSLGFKICYTFDIVKAFASNTKN